MNPASPLKIEKRPSVTITSVSTVASSKGRITVRSTTTPPTKASTTVTAKARKKGTWRPVISE